MIEMRHGVTLLAAALASACALADTYPRRLSRSELAKRAKVLKAPGAR